MRGAILMRPSQTLAEQQVCHSKGARSFREWKGERITTTGSHLRESASRKRTAKNRIPPLGGESTPATLLRTEAHIPRAHVPCDGDMCGVIAMWRPTERREMTSVWLEINSSPVIPRP